MKTEYLISKSGSKFSMKFSRELESDFENFYFEKSILTTRIALILGAVLYSLFAFLDILIAPIEIHKIWIIRFLIVVPLLVLLFAASFFNAFRKYMQSLTALVSMAAGLGILAIISIASEAEGKFYYYAGLILVIMWTYTLVRLRFIYATAVCWILVIIYELINLFYFQVFETGDTRKIFFNNNFFFISSNIIGMFAGYLLELYTRNDFLYKIKLSEKQKELQKDRDELKANNERFQSDLEMARSLQEYLLPMKSPYPFINFLYKPMEEVGGDLYDFIAFNDGERIGLFISDVSGHGVPSAFITAMIITAIHDLDEIKHNPAEFLLRLNDALHNLIEEHYATAFYGIYNLKEKNLVYSNAGHPPPILFSNGVIKLIEGGKSKPLGIFDSDTLKKMNSHYNNAEIKFQSGDRILIYTDGIIDAKNVVTRERYSSILADRIIDFSGLSSNEFLQILFNDIISFSGNNKLDDDICMMCLDVEKE